ncbi:MAG: hypothetical protein P4L42_13475 [Desulfocapsaceae bacterium]|nr:hypothetical protein [Desulfocapsaceae bacterium]
MNFEQIKRHHDLLQSIVVDAHDIEQIAFGSLDPDKRQALGERLSRIRQMALTGVNDQEITARILEGYRRDCINSLYTIWGMTEAFCTEVLAFEDEQMPVLILAFQRFTGLVERYLQLKTTVNQETYNG